MKQNNQSSWAARLRKLSALCLMLVVASSAWADNKVDNNLVIKPRLEKGKTGKIAISLDNTTPYTAFQMEINLPAGLTIEPEGAIDIASARKNAHHVPYHYYPESGIVKVVAYSFDGTNGNEAFVGESGDLLTVTLTATEAYNGGEIEVINDEKLVFVEMTNLTGVTGFKVCNADVNFDGQVDTQDALKAIGYYVAVPRVYKSSADINGDGVVDTQDALKIVGIYLTPIEE